MRKFIRLLLVAGLGILAALPAVAQPASVDQDFANKVAQDSIDEVTMARLAAQQAQSQQVRDLARKISEEQSKATADLQAIAKAQAINLPTAMSAESQADAARIAALSGQDFDRAFLGLMVANHEKALSLFRGEAQNGTLPALKEFAARLIPTIEQHLKASRQILEQPAAAPGKY